MGSTNTELSPSAVRALSEQEFARWQRERGRRIVFAGGRYWIDHWGFFRLTHFAATVGAGSSRRPSRHCWALHALLPEPDAGQANAWSPLHLVRDLAAYDEKTLDGTRRKQLRRCRKAFAVVQLTDPKTLADQGWPILSHNARRLRLPTKVTRREFVARSGEYTADTRRLIIAAVDGDRLLAYLETFAVEDTAYLDEIYLSEDALEANLSAFLHFEAAQVYRRSGKVRQLCAGPPLPERMGVSEFKRRIGMPIVRLPARFWAPPPLQYLLKVAKPSAHYRATGTLPRGMEPEGL